MFTFTLLFQTLTMLLLLSCGQRILEWPGPHTRAGYTRNMGIHSSKGDLNISTAAVHELKYT